MKNVQRNVLTAVLIAVAIAVTSGAETRPGDLPTGVTVYPSLPDQVCKVIELDEPADVLVQGPLPVFALWTPAIKDGGRIVIVTGKAGDYNVLVFPASGVPRVKGFTINLGPIKPPVPPTPPNPAPTITATVTPLSITLGQSATLLWTAKNATTCTLDGQTVATDGKQLVTPTAAGVTQYKMTATGKGGTASKSISLTVTVPPKPSRLWAVIVYDAGQDVNPHLADVLRGKAIQDHFVAQKWTEPDGAPSLVRTEKDNVLGILPPDQTKWVTAAIAAAKSAGTALPALAWSGSPSGPWTVEVCKMTETDQLARLTAIAGGAP